MANQVNDVTYTPGIMGGTGLAFGVSNVHYSTNPLTVINGLALYLPSGENPFSFDLLSVYGVLSFAISVNNRPANGQMWPRGNT